MTRRIRQLEEEKLSFKDQVRKLSEQLQLPTTSLQERAAASSAESTAEMAEALRENTVMNTMSSEEMTWMDEPVRYNTAGPAGPFDQAAGTGGCTPRSKNVQRHGGTRRTKELSYNEEAQELPWLTLLAAAFSPNPWSKTDHNISGSV